MPSNGLSLSQWDLSYAKQIAALLTSSWKTLRSTTVTGEPSTMKVDGGTKVGVGDRIQKSGLGSAFFDSKSKVPILRYTF